MSTTRSKFQVLGEGCGQLINVRMKNLVDKADRWRFVWVCIRELDVDFPLATLEGC